MTRLIRLAMPAVWTLTFLIPVTYVVVWIIESYYGVAMNDASLRFERAWAALLLVAAPLVLAARGWITDASAPRMKLSRVHDLAISKRRGWFVSRRADAVSRLDTIIATSSTKAIVPTQRASAGRSSSGCSPGRGNCVAGVGPTWATIKRKLPAIHSIA